MNIKMRVKSKDKLLNLLTNDSNYCVHQSGYKHRLTDAYINSSMLNMAGMVITLSEYNFDQYDYKCRKWLWKKEWLEEVNPIWLQQKGK